MLWSICFSLCSFLTVAPRSESDLVQETAVLLASLSDTILSPERPQRPLPLPVDPPTGSTSLQVNEKQVAKLQYMRVHVCGGKFAFQS